MSFKEKMKEDDSRRWLSDDVIIVYIIRFMMCYAIEVYY